jgi:hypothetical protein
MTVFVSDLIKNDISFEKHNIIFLTSNPSGNKITPKHNCANIKVINKLFYRNNIKLL